MKMKLTFSLLCFFILCTNVYAQQTTGNLFGRILDESDEPIPAVNIVASGESMQGIRGAVTDEFGYFRIIALQVGLISVNVSHIAYQPIRVEPVQIQLGKTTTLGELKLASRTMELEEVIVTAKRPLIDPSTTTIGMNLEIASIEQLPVQRDHRSIAALSPQGNVSDLGDDVNIAGSTGLENLYFIDGMNTTDPNFGRTSSYLPYNFVKEVEIITGGYTAEYRSALGGIINVITPSGGNEFTGQAFGFFTNDAMRNEPRLGVIEYDINDFRNNDVGLSFGGPLVRDKLWFYTAYNYTIEKKSIGITDFGMQEDIFKRHVFAGKLTWRASDNTDVILSLFADPGKRESVAPSLYNSPMPQKLLNLDPILGDLEDGGTNMSLSARHVINKNIFIDGRFSRYDAKQIQTGRTEIGNAEPQFLDVTTGTYSGGYFNRFRYQSIRYHASLSGTLLLGKHIIKSGFEYETNTLDSYTNKNTVNKMAENLFQYVYHIMEGEVSSRIPSAYVQDSWLLTSRLQLNIGIRWDAQYFYDVNGDEAQTISDQFQPRLGFTYQTGTIGTQKIYGHYGRFYEQIPTNFLYFHLMPRNEFLAEYDHDPRLSATGGDTLLNFIQDIVPGVDDLQGQHLDEFVLGYEREIVNNFKISINGTYRALGQAIQSIVTADNDIIYGNPGKGALSEFPEFTRTYTALMLKLEKFKSERFNFIASYVLSRNYGNYSGVYDAEHRLEFPNATRTLAKLEQIPNNTGLLPNDRTHSFKFIGSYVFDFGLSFGSSFFWQSGTPLNEFGGSVWGAPFHTFLVQRGTAGRTTSIWDLNFRLSYNLNNVFRSNSYQRLILDIFHVASRREIVDVEQRHYFMADAEGNQMSENPTYLEPFKFQPPMTMRLGIEVGF